MSRVPPADLPASEAAFARQLRSCLRATVRELKASQATGRTLSLPNLRRIFLRRWHPTHLEPELVARGRALGLDFIAQYYRDRQPFEHSPHLPHNGNPNRGCISKQ